MTKYTDFIEKTADYIQEYNLDLSPEQMFIEFNRIVILHRKFEAYCNNSGLTIKLNKMQRSKRLKEKRKLFVDWYILQNQNTKILKEMIYELSEMIFSVERTVEKDIYSETTTKTPKITS